MAAEQHGLCFKCHLHPSKSIQLQNESSTRTRTIPTGSWPIHYRHQIRLTRPFHPLIPTAGFRPPIFTIPARRPIIPVLSLIRLPRSDPNVHRSLLLPNEPRPEMRWHKFLRFMKRHSRRRSLLVLFQARNRRGGDPARTGPTERAKRDRIGIGLGTGLIRNWTMIGGWGSR